MERSVLIRAGVRGDLPALTEIYNHYVKTSVVTFDLETKSVDQRVAWFEQFDTAGPYRLLVAERDSMLLGYACSARFRPKPAYDRSVETSVYLAPGIEGGGIGTALYSELFATLEHERVHRAYGIVALPNDASRHIHLKFGFESLHTLSEVGYKFDRYVDTEWFEKKFA
ncbi:MAG: N-acetyltransferase family protein [Pseudomonadota bacterium]